MRRRFRREIRKTLAQEVPPILQEANYAFSKGEYGRAAELFEKIARVADGRGGPRAPLFHLQAGRARVFAEQAILGIPSLKRGLELLAERGQLQRLHQAGMRTIHELKERGLKDETEDIEILLSAILPKTSPSEPLSNHPALPTHCPSCGAALRPDEVEWLDDVTAECGYCGSPVREDN